jgi:hypothetical protein
MPEDEMTLKEFNIRNSEGLSRNLRPNLDGFSKCIEIIFLRRSLRMSGVWRLCTAWNSSNRLIVPLIPEIAGFDVRQYTASIYVFFCAVVSSLLD